MALQYNTEEIKTAGVFPLGLCDVHFDLFVKDDGTKNASIYAHFDNGARHLDQRFFFFDRTKYGQGIALNNTFLQLLYAGLAPEPLFPLLEAFNEAQENFDADVQKSLQHKITEAQKTVQDIISQMDMPNPTKVNVGELEQFRSYIDGGTLPDGQEFEGWATRLVDRIYAVYTIEYSTQRGMRIVIPQNKDQLQGLPFVVLPLWWGPGTGIEEVNPEFKLPYSNMTPEEWVSHSREVRASIQKQRSSRKAELGQEGFSVLQQMGKLGFGGGGSGESMFDSGSPDSNAGADDSGDDDPPF